MRSSRPLVVLAALALSYDWTQTYLDQKDEEHSDEYQQVVRFFMAE